MAFLLRRLAQAVLVLLSVTLLAFVLFRFVGDPVNQMVGMETGFSDREALRERLGLNDAVPVQFLRYAASALSGDFGLSYQHKRPVLDLIAERLPATLELALAAAIFAIALGVPLGVHTALHPRGVLARLVLTLSLLGVSLPTFLTGILLIFIFSVHLGWLPSFGRGEVVHIGFWSTGFLTSEGLRALILPAVTLGLFQLALILRLVRSEMLEVLGQDFIRFARARGLSSRAVHYGHGLRNALMPVITIIGLQFGSLIAFAVITESVFQWPGLGLLFLAAIETVDIPVMAAYLVLTALLFVLINLTVDLLYLLIDPRLRNHQGRPA